MSKGRVSIIIPVYNSEVYIEDTLESILAQQYPNWECLCVDDGSVDGSAARIQNYVDKDSRISYVSRPKDLPKGGNSCRNYGFTQSTGEFVQWIDSDDLMLPEMLSAKVKQLQEHEEYHYVICRTAYFYGNKTEELHDYDQHLESKNVLLDFLNFKTKFFTSGPLFRREFLDSMPLLFNQQLMRHQEKEFYFRVILRDSKYAIIDHVFVLKRMHDNQLGKKVNRSTEKSKWEYIANVYNYESFVLSKASEPSVQRYFKEFFFKYIRRFVREGNFKYAFLTFRSYIKALLNR